MIDIVCKNRINKHQNRNGRPEREENGEEVGRSVRKNRVMKEKKLAKADGLTKPKSKCMTARDYVERKPAGQVGREDPKEQV
jgi:hypothetical protein